MKISVVGLGKLGACLAGSLASKGYDIIGIDIDNEVVDTVNAGKAPVTEPGLQELYTTCRDRLTGTTDYAKAITDSDITFMVTATPSEPDGHFSTRYMESALESLAKALGKSDKDYHLFIITSTVSPGTTDESLIPLIEKASGRKLNQGFGVCYNPEFIALGSVIRDFLNPDLVLIGESGKRAGDILTGVHETVCENEPQISRMSIISAEIMKISLNSYVTMKISFANTLAAICQNIPGADVDAISQALGADKRISPYYIRGGLAFGGPCFPRDNKAFINFARKYGREAALAEATDRVNYDQIQNLKELVLEHLPDDRKISLIGLAYKVNTPVIEESAAVKLTEELINQGLKITVFDPLATDNARRLFGDKINYASSLEECLTASDCWVITLPYQELRDIDESLLTADPTIIIDCWRTIDPARFGSKVRYVALGKAEL